jgi:uridine kinase
MIDFTELATTIPAQPASVGKTTLVCIDGRAGSGKTTCAVTLQELMPGTTVIHMDDLYDGWSEDLDVALAQRVMDQIITPLAKDETAKYQRFNWESNIFDKWVEVPASRIIVLEGVGSAYPLIREHAALSIWIEIESALGAQRVIARDGDISRNHIAQWQSQEDVYIQKHQTPPKCDYIFSGA